MIQTGLTLGSAQGEKGFRAGHSGNLDTKGSRTIRRIAAVSSRPALPRQRNRYQQLDSLGSLARLFNLPSTLKRRAIMLLDMGESLVRMHTCVAIAVIARHKARPCLASIAHQPFTYEPSNLASCQAPHFGAGHILFLECQYYRLRSPRATSAVRALLFQCRCQSRRGAWQICVTELVM